MIPFTRAPTRSLLAGWLIAAACSTPCASAETAGRELAETTRTCRALDTQLVFGLRNREVSLDELSVLLSQGGRLLLKAAGFDQDPLAEHLSRWREAVARAVAAIENAKATAINAAIQRTGQPAERVTIDPWAGPDQECGYDPPLEGPVPTNWDFELPATDLGRLPEQIPPKFRLAEFLGLGRNRLRAELDWISPQLMRRQTDAEWGLHVFGRMQCILIGHFVPPAGQAADPRESLETFRLLISSQGLKQIITTRTGSDLGNPKAYRAEQSNDTNMLGKRYPDNPWWRENLAAAAAERGWRLQPATAEAAESHSNWLDAALQQELASWQDQVAEVVRRDPAVVEALQALEDLRTSFFIRLQSLAAQPQEDGESTAPEQGFPLLRADSYPELTAAAQLVAAGRLDRVSLARLAPAIDRALNRARRAAWADAAKPPLHTNAVQLARALDALNAWTLP